jgi:hypothetical protein
VFCEKKNLSVRRKIFKVWRGGECLSIEFRVFGKKRLKEKFWERKKNQSIFWWKFKVWDFAKFIFTGWAFMLICKLKLRKKKWKFSKCFSGRGYPVSWAPCCEWTKSCLRRWASCWEWTKSCLRRWASCWEQAKSWMPRCE